MYLFKWYSLKISSISFFHSWKYSPSSIGTLCLRLPNIDSSIFLQWWLNQSKGDQSSDTNWKDRGEVSIGGVNRLLARKVAVFNFFKLRWRFSTCLNIHNTYQASMTRVYGQRKVKHAILQECKGMGLECANAIWDTDVFVVVPIGGAIVHPRWWRLQPTKGNGCASPRRAPPTKGPRRSNLVYHTMAIAHEGLASLG